MNASGAPVGQTSGLPVGGASGSVNPELSGEDGMACGASQNRQTRGLPHAYRIIHPIWNLQSPTKTLLRA
jgi:hypothetical protein